MPSNKKWKNITYQLKAEIHVLYLAYKDPRVPWHAKILIALIVGYAFSPIDLIPDFIPILGYLDDLIIIPLGITLARKMLPQELLEEYRQKAKSILHKKRPRHWIAAVIIILIWMAIILLLIKLILKMIKN